MPGRLTQNAGVMPMVLLAEEDFTFASTKLRIKFKIPYLKTSKQSALSPETRARAIELHSRFRLEVAPYEQQEQTLQKAKVEMKSVLATFPYVHDLAVITCMSAWFFLLCHVDDLVEGLDPAAAKIVLKEILVFFASTNREKNIIDASSGPQMTDQVLKVVSCFSGHLTNLLPIDAYGSLLLQISQVFEAMVEEIDFRSRKKQDVSQYVSLRERTIGLGPFFELLRIEQGCSTPCSENLMVMQQCIHLVVGMQNDVVGLEKDVACGELMNYPMIHAAYRGGADLEQGMQLLESSILKAVRSHNLLVELTVKLWDAIGEEANEQERQVAFSMMAFVVLHFKWSAESKRYKN